MSLGGITGFPFLVGANHVGDRVTWDGSEWRVGGASQQTGLLWLHLESQPRSDETTCLQVLASNTRMAWCPKRHGGAGKPEGVPE